MNIPEVRYILLWVIIIVSAIVFNKKKKYPKLKEVEDQDKIQHWLKIKESAIVLNDMQLLRLTIDRLSKLYKIDDKSLEEKR